MTTVVADSFFALFDHVAVVSEKFHLRKYFLDEKQSVHNLQSLFSNDIMQCFDIISNICHKTDILGFAGLSVISSACMSLSKDS